MRSNETFATQRSPTGMVSRKDLLMQLGSHWVKDLRDILTHVRLRESDADADAADRNDPTPSKPKNDQDNATPAQAPVTENMHHGVFGQVYAASPLLQAHTRLYADFGAAEPADVAAYIRAVNKIEVSQWPCFVVCTGG